MVHVISKNRYGALNEYKAQTPAFTRSFRAILSIVERVSNDYHCSPEGALALLCEHLPLSEFTPKDSPIHLDIRQDETALKQFLSTAYVSPQMFLLNVIETLLRLPTRNGTEAVALFELARLKLGGLYPSPSSSQPATVQSSSPVTVQPSSSPSVSATTMTSTTTPHTKKVFKTKKRTSPSPSSASLMSEETSSDKLSKLDESLRRSRKTLKQSQETLAKNGQFVPTNPLLGDFL